ncbi:MAG TPA: thioredoxin family protein [Leptospiraceae bacterium]|nr:thioredoxin family protein [Leptospiraceae bacterium]HMY33781.1 thioredoxin family protein [Leptospiraceae bacterium]HMZ64845.1 thioredoxin family protein [Leptospiraceae bacterium]HNA10150.1 thioredoxin family protein [Leptospiraceae bacterium]HNB99371.1 thioredoxin family protein [Leptospiraceae bacterium]
MKIKILGTGCQKCVALEYQTQTAVNQLQLDATIEKVTDMEEIMKYDILSTPALVIDEQVIFTGKVLKTEEIKTLLLQYNSK